MSEVMTPDDVALTLEADGRVRMAAWYRLAPEGVVIVPRSTLPEGDVTQYRYADGAFVHDPLPTPEPETPAPTQEERIAALEQLAAEQDAALIELAALIGGGA